MDAQATEGMLHRQGAGKQKHLTVRTLWVQSAVVEYSVKVIKIPRSLNHADALCSFHTAPEFHEKMHCIGLRLSTTRGHGRRGGEQTVYAVRNAGNTRRTRRQWRTHLMMLAISDLIGEYDDIMMNENANIVNLALAAIHDEPEDAGDQSTQINSTIGGEEFPAGFKVGPRSPQ